MNWERHEPDDTREERGPFPFDADIEPMLLKLMLRRPTAELDARVWRMLTRPTAMGRLRMAWLGAAAAIAIASATAPLMLRHARITAVPGNITMHGPSEGKPHAPPARRPLLVERQIARVADDGVIGTANGVPVQLYRYQSVRQVWYFDPTTGKKLRVTVPRNAMVLVAVRTF